MTTEKVPAISYKDKVKLSDTVNDALQKQTVSDAVYRSGLAQHHKLAIYKEVKKGKLSKVHADAVRKIIQAENTGGVYYPQVSGQL